MTTAFVVADDTVDMDYDVGTSQRLTQTPDGKLRSGASGGGASAALPTGTNRSGTAGTTSGALNVPANPARKSLVGQNVSAVDIGINEFGGVAVIGEADTYTVAPNQAFSISTQNLINFIAASGTAAVAMTET